MKANHHRFGSGRRLSGFSCILAVIAHIGGILPGALRAEGTSLSALGDKVIVESGGATQVVEKVRARAPGVLMEVHVRVGDSVKKGQALGNTELAPTKYQLNLARQALANNASLNATEGQADAWSATREETEAALRKRTVEKSRLDWATGMEKYHRGNYEAQLEQKKVQRIQYEYWQEQYESRFFRSPVDGIVTEVLLEPGKPVNYATHVFTVGNEESFMIPVTVPAELAAGLLPNTLLPVRATTGKHVARGTVDSIANDPKSAGKKIIKLLVSDDDFPGGTHLSGTKFDVLLPQAADPPQTVAGP
ncbi:MAG: HlyD family efflux transporter periplasmic adaptor subunit [Luteolibacter sp.]|jgi:multidrug efflux pump subunit AcrA (membrane-fusion protein)|nr:HlyD family efflux transporter periplasmic adaptor subunit [Luteolibacter sp.]